MVGAVDSCLYEMGVAEKLISRFPVVLISCGTLGFGYTLGLHELRIIEIFCSTRMGLL